MNTMKLKIEYFLSGTDCAAKTYFGPELIVGLGMSWDDAKNRVLEQIREIRQKGNVPEPEEVEL